MRLAMTNNVTETQRVKGSRGVASEETLPHRANKENKVDPSSKSLFGPDFQVELSSQEIDEVERLKERDQEVRQHEQAHLAKAGSYAQGGAKYQFENGPDGRRYATEGEVSIDTGKEATPEKTLQKAQVVQRAALGVEEPSPADRKVASDAKAMAVEARKELSGKQDIEKENSESSESKSKMGAYHQSYLTQGQHLDLSA